MSEKKFTLVFNFMSETFYYLSLVFNFFLKKIRNGHFLCLLAVSYKISYKINTYYLNKYILFIQWIIRFVCVCSILFIKV